MTTELVLAELLCCDCECVFCNSLVFYVSACYFISWAVVSAGYPALSSSYFERINDDDDDEISKVSPSGGEPICPPPPTAVQSKNRVRTSVVAGGG